MQNGLPNFFKSPHTLSSKSERSAVLVALSGGADSSTLLHVLCQARAVFGFELYAAHVNHGIRTEEYANEALRDEEFCRRICEQANVELYVKRLDVPALAKNSGRSLETEAREARYAFFAEIMKRNNIKILATAHNANDNLETQIFNLCRGCGVSGACGIPEVRSFDAVDGGVIVRPILSAARDEILEYCRINGIEHVTDSTNQEDDCTRNVIRHKIIPTLRELFASPEKNSLRLSTAAREDDDFLCREAQKFLLDQQDGIDENALLSLHRSLSKRVLRIAFEGISDATLEAVHVNDLLSFALSRKNGSVSLPGGISACFCDKKLYFKKQDELGHTPTSYSVKIGEGFREIDGTCFAIMLSPVGAHKKNVEHDGTNYALYSSAHVYLNETSSLSVENRREGDMILDGGMHKRLKKLMCDKKVPLSDRSELPIVKKDGEIIYVPLCAVSDTVRSLQPNYSISIYKKTEEYHVK